MAKNLRTKTNKQRAAELIRRLVEGECGEGLRRSALRAAERLEGRPAPRVRRVMHLAAAVIACGIGAAHAEPPSYGDTICLALRSHLDLIQSPTNILCMVPGQPRRDVWFRCSPTHSRPWRKPTLAWVSSPRCVNPFL